MFFRHLLNEKTVQKYFISVSMDGSNQWFVGKLNSVHEIFENAVRQ